MICLGPAVHGFVLALAAAAPAQDSHAGHAGSVVQVVVPGVRPKASAHRATMIPVSVLPPSLRTESRPTSLVSSSGAALSAAIRSYFGLALPAPAVVAKAHCRPNRCDHVPVNARDRVIDRARLSTLAVTVTPFGATTGAVLLFSDRNEARAVGIQLPGRIGVALGRRF